MPVAGPIIGAVGAIGGGLIASSGAKKAANTAASAQVAADQAAIAEQRRQFDETRADLAPWVGAGQGALGMQGNLLGLAGPAMQQQAIAQLQGSPLYQALFGTGQNTLLANASATGGLRGGNTQRSLADFGRDTLSTVIENQLTRLGGVSEQGQSAAAQTGAFGAGTSGAIAELLADQGAARAGAALAGGAANASMIKDITGALTGLAANQDVQNWVGKLR